MRLAVNSRTNCWNVDGKKKNGLVKIEERSEE